MWVILQLIRIIVLAFLALAAARIGAWLTRVLCGRASRETRRFGWRWRLAWVVMFAISAALIAMQVGGFYSFTDSRGGDWSYFGHGWPLGQQFSLSEAFELHRGAEAAFYLVALAVNLISLVVILAAVRLLLDRQLSPSDAKPRSPREFAVEAAGWLAALMMVLLIDRTLADPVKVPGTSILFYAPLAHEIWYCKLPILFGLGCLLLVVGQWLTRGVKAVVRLRKEGVI